MERKEVEAIIYRLSGNILRGQGSRTEIEEVVKLATEHDLLPLVNKEFKQITNLLQAKYRAAEVVVN